MHEVLNRFNHQAWPKPTKLTTAKPQPDMMIHTRDPGTWTLRQKEHEFKDMFGHLVSSRLA